MIDKNNFYSLPLNIINGKEMKEMLLYYDFVKEKNSYCEEKMLMNITYPYINRNVVSQLQRSIRKRDILKITIEKKSENKKRTKKISDNYINNIFNRFSCIISKLKVDFNNCLSNVNINFDYLPSSLKTLYVQKFNQHYSTQRHQIEIYNDKKIFLLPNSLEKVSIDNFLIYLPYKTRFIECKNFNYILNTKKINLKVLIEGINAKPADNIENTKYKKKIRTQFHYFTNSGSTKEIFSPIKSNTVFIDIQKSYNKPPINDVKINNLESKNLFIEDNKSSLNSIIIKNYYNNILIINGINWYNKSNLKNIELLNKCKILQIFGNFDDFSVNTIIRDCILFIISKENKGRNGSYIDSKIKTKDGDYFYNSETPLFDHLYFKSLITS